MTWLRSQTAGQLALALFGTVLAALLLAELLYALSYFLVELVFACLRQVLHNNIGPAMVLTIGDIQIDFSFLVSRVVSILIAGIGWLAICRPWLLRRTRLDALKQPQRSCPRCYSTILAAATRCPYCTSEF